MENPESKGQIGFYKHVPLPENTIRVLALYPARKMTDPISCSLQELSLEPLIQQGGELFVERRILTATEIYAKISPYEALSYVWGSPTSEHKITCNGKIMLITANCLSALKHLRQEKKPRLLWIDAICIDQSSSSEKKRQLELMNVVYSIAKRVLIWLGEGNENTSKIMRRMRWAGRYCRFNSELWLHAPRNYKSRQLFKSWQLFKRVVSAVTFGKIVIYLFRYFVFCILLTSPNQEN